MFENQRFFSHLSPLERELSFRTEMGLYYSYYKTVVYSDSFTAGLRQLLQDNVTEYPDTINTFRRFNLLPEVILSAAYRVFQQFGGAGWKECYQINRGFGQPPIHSCVGLGEPSYFYLYAVFSLNGVMLTVFCLLCYLVSDSVLAALLGTLQFFYNHGEATRVQWTPPLRESFAFPFLILQLLLLSNILRSRQGTRLMYLCLSVATLCFMLPWQFAQFALLTQILSLFGVYLLRLLNMDKFQLIVMSCGVSFILNVILQFGNTLLLSSYYASCLLACLLVTRLLSPTIQYWFPWLLSMLMEVSLVLGGTVGIKMLTSLVMDIKDDVHIGALLLAKFTSYQDFHTQLYTCAAEFDFLSFETVQKLTTTVLLPLAGLSAIFIITKVLSRQHKKNDDKQDDGDVAMLVYHLVQCSAFAVMAILIMRLKLFLTPQLAVMASIAISPKVLSLLSNRQFVMVAIVTLCASSIVGVQNLREQINILDEFNAFEQEELVMWVNNSTPQDAVFAGAMPTTATIKLTTNRPIVNHPHYEDAGIRHRTKQVYQIYSRHSPQEIHRTLREMKVDYVIIEPSWCNRQYRPGCAVYQLWDYEEPDNVHKPIFCQTIQHQIPKPFQQVFNNNMYQVLKVN
ncbi:protein C-mannosyl-transferase DPY19L1-like isoform X2 [Dysidea avara]